MVMGEAGFEIPSRDPNLADPQANGTGGHLWYVKCLTKYSSTKGFLAIQVDRVGTAVGATLLIPLLGVAPLGMTTQESPPCRGDRP